MSSSAKFSDSEEGSIAKVDPAPAPPAIRSDALPVIADLVIAVVFALFYLGATFTMEKITACNGFGHDGCNYGAWALDFDTHAFKQKLGTYRIQRCFPSLVVWGTHKLFHKTPTTASVIRGFQWMNIACVFIGVLCWTKIARILKVRTLTTLFGTLALFGTYGVLKFTTWYPVLGDMWGYTFGFAFLYAYLARRIYIIIPLAIISAFTWPSAFPLALILLFFWGRRDPPAPAPYRLNHLAGVLAAAAWTAFTLSLVQKQYHPPSVGQVDWIPSLTRLAVLIIFFYFYFAIRALTDYRPFYNPLNYLKAFFHPGPYIAFTLLYFVKRYQGKWSVPEPAGFEMWLQDTSIMSTWKPGVFLLAYAVYFGPLIIVFLLRWRHVVEIMKSYGGGILSIAILGTLFGVDAEERHGYTFLAIVLPFALKALDDLDLPARVIRILAILCVVFSKVYITLPGDVFGNSWDFPAQAVFMSQGPWMANTMYLLQGAIVLLVAAWLYWEIKKREREKALTA